MYRKPFSVIVKPAGSRCNMRCRYCYYLEKSKYSTHETQTVMSDGLLEALIVQAIEASPGPDVSFVWHGGEPMLAGLDFYRKAVDLQKKYLPAGWRVWNNLQTNGLLLDREWCEFLRKNEFDVGVSVDGTQAVHDVNRVDAGGAPTYEKVRRAVRLLLRAGVIPDLLCTVTAQSAERPAEVYRALRSLGTGWMQFIPVQVRLPDGTLSAESVTPEAYGRFLCEIFDIWCHEDLGKNDVQLFAEISRVLAGGEPTLCMLTPECGRVLVAEEDGSVYMCDHFVDDAHRLGSLTEGTLTQYVEGERQTAFGASKKTALPDACRVCPYLKLCGGGCLKDRVGEDGRYALCDGLRMFFDHAVPVVRRMITYSRTGMDAGRIMAKLNGKK